MKNKKSIIIIIIVLVLVTIINIILVRNYSIMKNDMIAINEIKSSVEKNSSNYSNNTKVNKYEYTIIISDDSNDAIFPVYSTFDTKLKSNEQRINDAYTNNETIVDFSNGKIIIYTNMYFKNTINRLYIIEIITGLVLCIIVIIYYIRNYLIYIKPFKTLDKFATSIASGNFNAPLSMDKKNIFGAFTESFDLMRNELNEANKKNIELELSKKEFLASLSHDIKTPLASIKAVNELLITKEIDDNKLNKLNMMDNKIEEIEKLINELFNSSIDDIMKLKFDIEEVSSNEIENIIKEADHSNKVIFINKIPECLLKIDKLKTYQIIDNIIANSYKYANTIIEVGFKNVGDKREYLQIYFKDFGQTLKEEELALLTCKFYRASNSKGHEGAGLGLYLCDNFLQRMNGNLEAIIDKDGFIVKVNLPLV